MVIIFHLGPLNHHTGIRIPVVQVEKIFEEMQVNVPFGEQRQYKQRYREG